jgi:hypothetical protein
MSEPRERRVTIGLEPIRWHGSPLIVWMAAGVAWGWVGLLLIVEVVR